MNKVYLLSAIIGSLEVAVVTFLTTQSFFYSGWWALGLLAYFLYCFVIGGTLKTVMTLAVTGMVLTLAYVKYGFLGVTLMYLAVLFVVEFIPFMRKRHRSTQ